MQKQLVDMNQHGVLYNNSLIQTVNQHLRTIFLLKLENYKSVELFGLANSC